MRTFTVYYDLQHGFIHNWLVAGPQQESIELERYPQDQARQAILGHYYEAQSGITQTPVERGPLTEGLFQVGDFTGSWEYYACREDHLVEKSGVHDSPRYLRSWAYTQLESQAAQEVSLVLFAHGPADLWVNDEHVQRRADFHGQEPGRSSLKAVLQKGPNKILVRFETVAVGDCPYAIALQVCKATDDSGTPAAPCQARDGLRVSLPTLIESIARRGKFERAAVQTYVTQDVFEKQDQIRLHWPADLDKSAEAVIRLMKPTGQIYAEATVKGTPGDQVFLQRPSEIPEGPYRIFMMPLTWEYYDHNLRITHELNIWNLGHSQFSAKPYGTYPERRQEALVSASRRTGLFAEIAKMALGQWTAVEPAAILTSTQLARPQDLLGLLGLLYRFGQHPQFPAELRPSLQEYILNFPYAGTPRLAGEPGLPEAQQILIHTAELLAGQYYPEQIFARSGNPGQWHRQHGEQLAEAWLHQRGAWGFSDWDSHEGFAELVLALSHLVDLAETEALWEMAAVVLDKVFVSLALNSFQGVFGSTHGRAQASSLKGGLLEPTSGIGRLLWGTGVFNHHIFGTVSLACLENYELPALIAEIAGFRPEELWSRERHAVDAGCEVNKVTYKTVDTMLCSAQDYRPGEPGRQEHIWQATLGPTAAVFVTHPACSSETASRQPNFWSGNARLPRVAQWKDVLIAVYQLPPDDWMGFTHAYFPGYAFDEYALRRKWAFARKGDGYLAITARQGLKLTNHGDYAFRELRSYGLDNLWVCHLGRAALDGDFSSFQKKILALELRYSEAAVSFRTLRGEVLSFGWQGPFQRNGLAEPLAGFDHYEHPFAAAEYPSRQMEVRYGEELLRLNFGRGSSPDPE